MTRTGEGSAIVVGAGLMGHWHAHAVEHGGGVVAAIVDADVSRAERLARQHAGARSFARLGEALGEIGAPVVHVCTPSASHGDLAASALEAGRHVLVEKPFARSIAETDVLLRAAQAAGRLAAPVHQFPFQRGALEAKAHLEAIGPLRHLELTICSAGAEANPADRDTIAAEIVPHLLSLVAAFSPLRITEGDWHRLRPTSGEWIVTAALGDIGVTGRISMSGRPAVNELRLIAEGGTTVVDLFHGFASTDRAGGGRTAKVLRPLRTSARQGAAATLNLARRVIRREPAYPGLRELISRFHRAVRTGAPSPITPDEIRDIMQVWLRVTA